MKHFNEYIDELCREHRFIRHSDESCHFSDLTSDFENKLKRTMNYPCVSLDTNGFVIDSVDGVKYKQERFNLYFLDHVRDVGNYYEIVTVFNRTRCILEDFLRRFERDRKALVEPLTHFDVAGSDATRIEFREAALFGWAVTVLVTTPFIDVLCNHNFDK